eukprot:ANDGO_00360.mRNA.1 Origin of replication complex subunit 6
MDVSSVLRTLQLPNTLRARAAELVRLSQLRCPGAQALAVPGICIEIACREQNVEFDRKLICNAVGVPMNMYIPVFSAVKTALGIQDKIDLQGLALEFGAQRVLSRVREVGKVYMEYLQKEDPKNYEQIVSAQRAAILTSAFAECCKACDIKVDVKKLLTKSGISKTLFESCSKEVFRVCGSLIVNGVDDCLGNRKRPAPTTNPDGSEKPEVRLAAIFEPRSKRLLLSERSPKLPASSEIAEDDYEVWKAKILAQKD